MCYYAIIGSKGKELELPEPLIKYEFSEDDEERPVENTGRFCLVLICLYVDKNYKIIYNATIKQLQKR